MITLSDIKVDGERWAYSLSKLIGKPIKDVLVSFSNEFGATPVVLSVIVFEDGTRLGCEGEHDFPYLVDFPRTTQPNFDDETLARLSTEADNES